ncbi:hypothetical protein ACHHYP_20800 [Achlya hypogyna]|uniref:NADAR domain-containing protein n=1 Tax=Achlya hypogyna TaxID=1202772 RepID=A0A1V9Y9A4_ACHHY|nr:hypothetical protein ACHHYP_20800 [Achlya hypogyna]
MAPQLPLDVPALVARIDSGESFSIYPFYGHVPRRPQSVDAACLSQWYDAPFEIEGVVYATAEHFMMAEKARLFDDAASLAAILSATHPGEAKTLGSRVVPFDDARWAAARFDIVVRGNLAKFSQHAALRRFLLSTHGHILVEASPRDCIWGVGLAATSPGVHHPGLWRGLNLLGFALMVVRSQLQDVDQA